MERLGDALEAGQLDDRMETGSVHGVPPFGRFRVRLMDQVYHAREAPRK